MSDNTKPGLNGIMSVDPTTPNAFVCGTCGRAWLEDTVPSARCPWEYDHVEVIKATPRDAGYWVAGSSHNTADEVCAHTVETAKVRGMPVSTEDTEILSRFYAAEPGAGGCRWAPTPEDGDAIREMGDDAVNWLNDHVAPAGYYFEFDEGLVLRRLNDDEL